MATPSNHFPAAPSLESGSPLQTGPRRPRVGLTPGLRALTRFGTVFLIAITLWACGSAPPSLSPQSTVLAATATPGQGSSTASPSASPAQPASPDPANVVFPNPNPTAPIAPAPIIPGRRVTVSIVAAGDIACDPAQNTGIPIDCDQAATAALIGRLAPTAVLPLGDLQYQSGTLAAFNKVFGLTWGRYRARMYPAVGNHEYLTSGASGYFAYFGGIAPYYSYNLGNWHMVSLDSECSHVGGCQAGSAQERWLKADLAAHPNFCTLLYWHEPRWSSGEHGNASQMSAIWADAAAAHVDVVLSGHNHDYERFLPLGAGGKLDPAGVTEFVVGTGGKNHYRFVGAPLTGEVVRDSSAFGVLRMLLGPTSFSWRFYSAPGYSFGDSGAAVCH